MKFTLDVFLSKTTIPTPIFDFPQRYSRVQLWQRKLNQPRSPKFAPKTSVKRDYITPVRLQLSALQSSPNYRNVLMLSTKAPSFSPFKRPLTPLFISKDRWAVFIWRFYRCHFIKINTLSIPHIFNLVSHFTFRGANLVGRNTLKRPMVHSGSTFQTYNL